MHSDSPEVSGQLVMRFLSQTEKLRSYCPLFLSLFKFSIEFTDSVVRAEQEKLEFASLNGHLYICCHIDGSSL